MQKIFFVTGNQNKLREAQIFLPEREVLGVQIDLPEIQTTLVTEVIGAKIDAAYRSIGAPCFVLDSSLIIDGLCRDSEVSPSFPGALIKDVFAHMGAENIATIVHLRQKTRAKWSAMIGYTDGVSTHFFASHLIGVIAPTPRGTQGYDWDTIFIPDGCDRTFAEMSFDEKQSYALTPHLYRQFGEFLAMAEE